MKVTTKQLEQLCDSINESHLNLVIPAKYRLVDASIEFGTTKSSGQEIAWARDRHGTVRVLVLRAPTD